MTVTSDDVETSLGRPLTDAELSQVDMWIGDAQLQIRLRLGDLDALDQDALDFVVREAVISRLRNPEALSSETIDDYTYRMPTESRRVTILAEWWDMLSPVVADTFSARRSFAVDTARWPGSVGEGAYPLTDGWCW